MGLSCFTGFSVDCGVRLGIVLSSYLFALYIDSIVDQVRNSCIGCYLKGLCMSVLLYADDILLISPSVSSVNKKISPSVSSVNKKIAPSVSSVNKLLHICEQELTLLPKSLHVYELALVSDTTVAQYQL